MDSNNIKNPLVSIICPAYNHEKYIAQCLDGFVMQKTNFPIEILVHDDASTDSTKAILLDYEKKFPGRFKNIYQTENQFSKNMMSVSNILFNAAKGKYIACCEGDDYWTDPLKLQKQVDFLEANKEYSIVTGNCLILNDEGSFKQFIFPFDNFNELSKKKQFSELLLSQKWLPVLNIVFRNNYYVISNFQSKPNNFPGDFQIIFNNLKFGKMYYSEENLGVYRIHENGVSRSLMNQNYNELLKEIFKYKIRKALKETLLITTIKLFLYKIILTYKNIFGYRIRKKIQKWIK